jgi:isopentenyldiphosphate isomerase
MEYVFFARTDGEIEQTDEEEIFDWKWVSQEDFLSMDA